MSTADVNGESHGRGRGNCGAAEQQIPSQMDNRSRDTYSHKCVTEVLTSSSATITTLKFQ